MPVYPQLEKLTLSFSLERMREWLGPDAPVVRQLLSKESPDTLTASVVDGSKLADPAVRKQLWDGGQAAIDASHDPMIELARGVDAKRARCASRRRTKWKPRSGCGAKNRPRALQGLWHLEYPPDATFTLRLNFGTVQGWREGAQEVEPFTHTARLFERATGQEPFKVPDSWLAVKDQLDPQTRFDLSTNNDIVGGNSGSPLIDTRGRVVGLMFDGNIHSIAGDYWFDPSSTGPWRWIRRSSSRRCARCTRPTSCSRR